MFRPRIIPWLAIIIFWVIFCWPMLSGKKVAGFRDTAYLYWPLYFWIQNETEESELPLWNPHDDFGYSLLGDASSALFYPGKILFAIDSLGYTYQFGLYLSIHLLIGALGASWMARKMGANPLGSTLAGLSFGFSGPVVFQTTNVIYLVGAAWLPWALGSTWLTFRRQQLKWPVAAGVFCALMILGGDLQTPYLVLCVVGFTGLFQILCFSVNRQKRQPKIKSRLAKPMQSIARVALIFLLACGLAAVQLVPSWQMAQGSDRNVRQSPRNVWQAMGMVFSNGAHRVNFSDFLARPKPNTHHEHIYQFSQPPWTLAELFWPNVSGQLCPINSRWIDAIPGADRMWQASLYQGLPVVIMALAGLFGPQRKRVKWLAVICVIFLLGSMGWYGLVWLLKEMSVIDANSTLADPVGGFYWLLLTFIPFLDFFRYPAKLFSFATLAIAVLAGVSARHLFTREVTKVQKTSLVVCTVSLLCLFVSYQSLRPWIMSLQISDGQFGPLVNEIAWQHIYVGLTMGVILPLGFCSILFFMSHCRENWVSVFVLLFVACDILIANQNTIPWVPQDKMEDLLSQSETHASNSGSWIVARPLEQVDRMWLNTSSRQRLEEIIAFQSRAKTPKFHLLTNSNVIGSFSSIQNEIQNLIRREIGTEGNPNSAAGKYLAATIGNREEIACLIIEDVQEFGGLISKDETFTNLMFQQLSIENDSTKQLLFPAKTEPIFLSGKIQPNLFQVQIEMPLKGVLLLPVAFSDQWNSKFEFADGTTLPAKIHRIGTYFCGVMIPSQNCRLILNQTPWTQRFDTLVTAASWIALAGLMIREFHLANRLKLKSHNAKPNE